MKILYKLITWPVAIIFLSQNIAWAVPAPQLSTINYQPLTIFVPAQYGSVEKARSSASLLLSKDQTVVLIKDAHCNYEAQTNIARILDILIRDYKIDLVCVEGAEGLVNTSPYNAFPDQEAREKVTDRYVKKGVLSASEALGISRGNKQPFTIWGVEDSRLYLEDLKAFRETFKDNAGYIQLVAQLIKAVTFLKDKNYNIRLLGFDKRYNEYEEDKISLSDWIKKLSREYGVRGKNHNLALKAIKLEGEIDFNKVESERAQLIKELEKTLPKEGLQELVKQSLLFKLGKIPAIEYYTYLGHFGLPFNLRKYIRLIRIQSRIDSDELFHELSCLESTIYTQLCQAEVEKKLHRIDYNLKILNKLLNLQISRQELEYYKANINEFNLEKIMEFINIQYKGQLKIDIPEGLSLQSAERFYELAIHRDKVLVSNLLAKMEKDKKQNAAMVIGGFHAEGIIKQLEDAGISYLVISPKITKIQEDNPYLSIMLDEKIDIDKLLENISLAPPLPLGNIGNPEVRKRLASALISSRKLPLDKYTGPAREALQALCTIAGIVPEEERPIAEFLQPAILADRIISEENPTFAAFLLELLKAQVRENTSEVKQALRKVVTDSGNPEIVKLAKGYIITPEEAEELKQRLWAHYQTTESGRQNGEIHYSHTMRLIPLATELAMQNNADMDILIAAVILHDISKEDGRLTPEGKAHTMRNLIEHHIRGAIKAREILTKMEKDSEFISRVEEAILRHMGPMGKYLGRKVIKLTAFMKYANKRLMNKKDREFKKGNYKNNSWIMKAPNDKESAILYIVDMMDMMADGITKITDLRQQPGSFFLGQDQKYAAENDISNVVSVSAYYSPNSAYESLLACGQNIERTAKRFGIEGAIELIGELEDAVDTFFKELDWKGINTGLDFAEIFHRLSKKSMYHYLIIRQLLSESDIGRYLDSETIDKLARNPEIKLEVHGRGEEVVKEGDPPDSIYLIVSGELAAKSTASGDIGILKKNDLFGETAVLTNQPQSATVSVESGRAILLRLTPKAIEGIKVELERLPPLSPIIPFPAVRQEPPPARVSLGTKSHKAGTPTEVYQAALAHFEELEVSEDLPNARGILSVKDIPGMGSDERENTKRIVDFIQKNGKPVETGLGLPVMIWDRPQDKELNTLLLDNLAKLLPEEFLTVLKANAPPEGLVLAILDKSQHLGENCQGDGFIGVNRYLLQKLKDATDQPTIDALSNLLQVILYHEFRHEALIFEKEVLMEKFGYRPEVLSTRENILEALGKLSPEKHRVLTAEVEFRQNLIDIEDLDPLGLEILISLRLIRPDSFFTASIMNPQRREELRELGQTLYDNRYDQEKIRAERTPIKGWAITPDGQVGQIEQVQYIPGVGYGITVLNGSELLIGALPGDKTIYTTDLASCIGIAFIGVKDGKPICGLAHILPSELERAFRESRILQILKEEEIEITQMQILVTNDNTVSINFIERAIENIKTAFPLPQDKLRILRSTANSHMAVGNDGVTVIRFVLDKKGNWAYGTPVRQREIIPSPWAKTTTIVKWHRHIKDKLRHLTGTSRDRVQKILDDEGPLGPKIADFIREQAVPPTQEQLDILSGLSELKPDISPDMVFFIPRDSLASELFGIGKEENGIHLRLDEGLKKIGVILIPSDNKEPLSLAATLIHESYHKGAMIKVIANISPELAMAIDEGMADILTEEMIAKILESGHPLARVLTAEINKAWEELLGLGIEGPAETAMDKWHRIAAETSIYAYYRDLVNALRMVIGPDELIRMHQTGFTTPLRHTLRDRIQYLEKLALELTVFLDNPFSIITTKEIRAVINNPDYNSVRYFAYRLFRELLIDPDNFPGIEKDPMAWLQFIRLYLMRGDIYSSLISELTNPLTPKSEHQANLRAHWERFLVLKETINIVAEIAQILKRYGIEIDSAKEKRLRDILLDAYEGKVQINLLELMQELAKRIPPEKIFQLTAEIAEPINRFMGPKEATKGGKMVAAVLQEILELIPEGRRIEAETEEERLLKTIQAIQVLAKEKGKEKGIDPNAMQSVFVLFKSGLEILKLDPSYKLDPNYFVLISQIEKLTGIDDKKIIEAFSKHGLARERAEPVPNSPLAQEVEKLGLYIELNNMSTRADLDLGLEKRRGLFYLDNLNARIERSGDIQFLSSVDAVNKDLARAYSEVQASPGGSIIDRTEKITLVISADTLMSIERDGRFLRFSYKPGIQALLRILANSKNIHIIIRADTQAKQVLEEAGILNEQITVEDTDKKLEDIRTDAELKDWAKDEGHVVFILTPKEGEELKTEGIKAFGIAPDTAFHAALVFGVIYAQAITMDEIVTAINSLKLLGVASAEVDEIVCQIREEGLGFFTVKLVRIEETLKEFQNRRLYFEAAA